MIYDPLDGPDSLAQQILDRNPLVFPFYYEAIDLAHRAFQLESARSSRLIPGVTSLRSGRTQINDLSCRYLRYICEPLLESGLINRFVDIEGGEVAVLPDGLKVRIKKCDKYGNTSNYKTKKIKHSSYLATGASLFPDQTPLDSYIEEGGTADVVFVAGDSLSDYGSVGVKLSDANFSPFPYIHQIGIDVLATISADSAKRVEESRAKLTG